MAFQAFENKRKAQLGNLTRRRKAIDELNQEELTRECLAYHRSELEKIRTAHDSIVESMLEQPECQEDLEERLQENMERFQTSYDEIMVKLAEMESRLDPTQQTAHLDENPEENQENSDNFAESSQSFRRSNENHQTSRQLMFQLEVAVENIVMISSLIQHEEEKNYPLEQLKMMLKNLSEEKANFGEIFKKISTQVSENEMEKLKETSRDVQRRFFEITSLLNEKIAEKMIAQPNQPSNNANGHYSSRVKLPAIEVPKFNGSPETWIAFRDLFTAMIHSNAQLSGSQKYRYLKTSLTDKLSPVKFDVESDDGYEDAWKKVIAFYDDKRKIVDNHFAAIFNSKKMSTESGDELQKLVNEFSCNIDALQRLVAPEKMFEVTIAYLASQRLDQRTRDLWETENDEEIPSWSKMKIFLEKRRKTLNAISQPRSSQRGFQDIVKAKAHHVNSNSNCLACNENHDLTSCSKFLAWDVNTRFNFAKQQKLCFTCLGRAHREKCQSSIRCNICEKSHHTLLHFGKSKTHGFQAKSKLSPELPPFVPHNFTASSNEQSSAHTGIVMEVNNPSVTKNQTLLSTILVYVTDNENNQHLCRALLDSGSDSNFMTSKCASKLNLKLENTCMSLSGISEKTTMIRHKTSAVIKSHYGNFEKKLDVSVMPQITGNIPSQSVNIRKLSIPQSYVLADPKFYESKPVDMLLNAEVFYDCLLGEKFRLPEGPSLIHTKFGWILGGQMNKIETNSSTTLLSCFSRSLHATEFQELNEKLGKFIEADEIDSSKPVWTAEEKYCEKSFVMTTEKDAAGKRIVSMPMKKFENPLGTNRGNAMRQFHALEKRRMKDEIYDKLYVEYMDDFINTNHMSLVSDPEPDAHYLPHHGVLKMSSTSTKLRTVFNASSTTETGNSLNNVLCVGPTIQPESIDIITRFREKKYVMTGDIGKMYRQIWVHPSQRKYLSLLWRRTPDEILKTYQLNVVTFGTACAPFLATRVLQSVADEYAEQFPMAAAILRNSFYVDDTMFGVDTIEEGIQIRDELRHMLSSAGMTLCKFTANHPTLLRGLPVSEVEISKDSNIVKALGILYDVESDKFSYEMKKPKAGKMTKADVLSEIACIYDPIGWLGPTVMFAKIFMKKLWLEKLDWKDELSSELLDEWNQFRNNLPAINEIKIPRRFVIDAHVKVELHGFCDASINGYGAVIYALSYDAEKNVQSTIICSKSRVAPNNQKTLAQLELCSATLLAKLIHRYAKVLSLEISNVILWSDSTIVLNWITMLSSKLKTFVGNRVAVIQELTNNYEWRHIKGEMNPADVVSRGLLPQDLPDCELWWNGPNFFKLPQIEWPQSIIIVNEADPEVAVEVKRALKVTATENLFDIIETTRNSARKVNRIFAFVLRFIKNVRRTSNNRQKGPLTLEELRHAENEVVKIVQKAVYPKEYEDLTTARDKKMEIHQVSKKSSLINLSPFMDENGVLRVRGRLEACNDMTFEQKHQIILPSCNYAESIVRDLHEILLHPTKSTLLAIVRQKFWIVKAKNIIKKVQHQCMKCFRVKPATATQLMADLPAARVNKTDPFVKTAVDYTGFYLIKSGTTRNAPLTKGYVAVFKCMVTGAIHLELASDLSTEACIKVLDRFVSRRGGCAEIFSDNGTCFEGADNELKKIVQSLEPEMREYFTAKNLKWNFTTPRSPSAGGIYESGVKLMKHHLKRVIDRPLTFENFTTLLCRIEAILNSRPITPMSDDPNDFKVLTPSHFLNGRSTVSMPERNHVNTPSNRLSHWEEVQKMRQIFWQQWHREYLTQLQKRPVNFREVKEFKIGELVLLKDDNLPPMKWQIGRIEKLFPGKDKVVRNVKVKTQNGFKERNVRYLCPLPIEKAEEESTAPAGECVS